MRFKAGDALALFIQLVDGYKRSFNNLRDSEKALAYPFFCDLEDGRFSRFNDLFRRSILLISFLHGRGGGMDESAQQRLVFYDFYVMLNVLDPGQAIGQ